MVKLRDFFKAIWSAMADWPGDDEQIHARLVQKFQTACPGLSAETATAAAALFVVHGVPAWEGQRLLRHLRLMRGTHTSFHAPAFFAFRARELADAYDAPWPGRKPKAASGNAPIAEIFPDTPGLLVPPPFPRLPLL